MIPFKLEMSRFYHPYFKLKILVSEQANKEKNTHRRLSATTLQLSTVQGFLCLTRNEKCSCKTKVMAAELRSQNDEFSTLTY